MEMLATCKGHSSLLHACHKIVLSLHLVVSLKCCYLMPKLLMFSTFAGRLSNKERKGTITEELLADPELSQARKRRFDKLQVSSKECASYMMTHRHWGQSIVMLICIT